MKTKLITLTLVIFCSIEPLFGVSQPTNKPKLTSPIIKWLDNKPLALDCTAMGDILHVRRELRKIQFGIQDRTTKEFVGFYLLEGAMRTLRWLAQYEKALEQELAEQKEVLHKKYLNYELYKKELTAVETEVENSYAHKCSECHTQLARAIKDAEECEYEIMKATRRLMKEKGQACIQKTEEVRKKYTKDTVAYDGELRTLTDGYQQKVSLLKACLLAAKQDFVKANEPFSAKMEGTKQMLLKLIFPLFGKIYLKNLI